MTKKKDPKDLKPMGRPSKYDPVFCDRVIEVLSKGHSIAGFAGEIGVATDTVFEWAKVHPDFSASLKIGKAASARFWEDMLTKAAKGHYEGGSASAVIFALKNRAKDFWREKIDHNVGGVNGNEAIKVEVEHHVAEQADNFTSKLIELAAKRGGEVVGDTSVPDKAKVEE